MRSFGVLVYAVLLGVGGSAQPTAGGVDPRLVNEQAWRCIGPAVMGGRIDDVAVVESDPAVAYVATSTAGLWKTTNHGTTFRPVFEDQPCQSIGAVALCQSKPEVVWVGTGEANNRQSSSWGCGVFRSTDGGSTWAHVGLSDTMHIARVVTDPRDPDVAYVAAVGRLWGPSDERGLFKTSDAGKTWKAVLAVDRDTGCTDVVMDPVHPNTLWAAMYQRRRGAWGFIGGGPGSGIYRTTDGGTTWTRLTKGLPDGDKGRIGLDVYRRNPMIVYAVVEHRDGGVFRSEDGGETWARQSATNPRPMYFSQIRVDPNDDQFVWLAGVSFARSRDGGKTFGTESGARLHADVHAIWINPANSKHMLVGCDGGIQWSHDRGQTWDHYNTIPLAQLYGIAYDMRKPYWVAGGLQDNGSWIGPSSLMGGGGPRHTDWQGIGGGDGFVCAIDPTDHNTVYSESQNGAVRRVHLGTGASKSITPQPEPGEPAHRWDWCTPFILSPHSPRKVLLGGNRLFVSTDRGDTWRRTDDLSTKPTVSEFELMGVKRGRAYPFPDLGSDYGQIVTVTESPVREGVIYVGTDDGNLQVSRDDGKTWANVVGNVTGVPKGTYVSRVHASPHSLGRVYATFDGHRSNDFAPYVYVSEDFGAAWRAIAAGIPTGSTVNVIRDHPRSENLLFAGTDRGLYVSTDRGARWTRFGAPLPTLRVDDVAIHPRENDLIVATHARGAYILDDIASLVAAAQGPVGTFALLPIRPAVMYRSGGMGATTGNRTYSTQGAPTGTLIRYWLKSEPTPEQRVTLTVEEPSGKVLRTRRLLLAEAGYNSTTWDFRRDPPSGPAGRRSASPAEPAQRGGTAGLSRTSRASGQTRQGAGQRPTTGGARSMAAGPRVRPGRYIVRLQVGPDSQTQELLVEQDPRITLAPGIQNALADLSERLLAAATGMQATEAGVAALVAGLERSKGSDAVKAAPKELQDKVGANLKVAQDLLARARGALAGRPSQPEGQVVETLGAGGQVVQFRNRTSNSLASRLSRHFGIVESLPDEPSRALRALMEGDLKLARCLTGEVRAATGPALRKLNAALAKAKVPVVEPVEQDGARAGEGPVLEEGE
jgi:photosystem II stability/assembly factor-like uncharacterized protein